MTLCGIVLACGLLKIPLEYVDITKPDQYAFTIVIIALAAVLVARWEAALKNAHPVPGNRQTGSSGPIPVRLVARSSAWSPWYD